MPHRSLQVIDAYLAALAANADLRAHVIDNEVRSLSEWEGELPALTVNYSDLPDADGDLGSWHRVVDFVNTAYASGATKREVTEALYEIQRQAHISMMSDLGLSFVWDKTLGEMPAPTIIKADRFIGSLTSRWPVRYLMGQSDPG